MEVSDTIAFIWAVLIAVAVLAYVLLDGFDLGIGILFAVETEAEDRDVMVNSIAPVWDGNETWLVLGGGGLFAVFPLAYATIMPAMYPTIIGMLLALVFRGVGFEFRFRARSRRGRYWWDMAFFGGSLVAALCQGLTLGGLLQGIKVYGRHYTGGWWDWLTPFSVLCAVAVVCAYALQGAAWLVWRTEGVLQARVRRHARVLLFAMLAGIVAVSAWTPFLNEGFMIRWFSFPNIVLVSPVPALVLIIALMFWRDLHGSRDYAPFLWVQALFVLCYAGLGISIYPYMVPPSLTIWDVASPRDSQLFLLVGAAVLIPMILCYTAFAYWTFRGKVRAGDHYH
ncbi:MAG TPA: cytochrome d ubiquinol oxidase subunit II [Acidisphaera sp.]|nr:cytochrome d ubiquinol oxidase subunit II [Acidisphaera sp.]